MQYIYDIIVGSLIFIYDLFFTLIYRSFRDPAISIIILSIVINLIVLPLYKRADDLQKEEQLKKRNMELRAKQIRSAFKSDERFMMLSAYYRICHYNPLSFLNESVPLLLQIPFFIAAYQFISSLSFLDAASFGPISNLIEPDRLLVIGAFSINVLPILMTAINLIAGFIYARGADTRLKVQITVTAIIFLVLLYNSPSGLVLYWTMNNIFSLAKNVVQNQSAKIKKAVKAFIAFSVLFITEILCITLRIDTEPAELLVICSISYILAILAGNRIKSYFSTHFPRLTKLAASTQKPSLAQILLTEATLSILLGLYIPTTILSSSAIEFVNASTGVFNYSLLTYPITIYSGLLLVWLTVIYYSYGDTGRMFISVFLSFSLVYSVINQFVFNRDFGTLYTDLRYDSFVQFSVLFSIINAVVGLFIMTCCLFLFIKKPALLKDLAIIASVPLLLLSIRNVVIISDNINDARSNDDCVLSYNGILRLSQNGNNVIVFMLDRAIGGQVPYIFDEKPDLLDSYRGFVYYPNTVSLGRCTNISVPSLFGGYEYSPNLINMRTDETIVKKYDEALLMMPMLFSQNGFTATVIDPPYAGYSDPSDLSIYNDYPDIDAYDLRGRFSEEYIINELENYDFDDKQRRNFIMFSLFKTAPVALRSFIYDNGQYIYNSQASGYSRSLIDNYSTLNHLTNLTSVDADQAGSFLLLQNETTHNPANLMPPDYDLGTPQLSVENDFRSYFQNRFCDGRTMIISNEYQWSHYCINVAAYEQIATWLDYLRDQNVYDNTRIIIVSDHGYNLGQFTNLITADGLDLELFCPVLLVKDFNSTEPFSIDNSFMTTADVPTLALTGLIDNPVNPFTGNPINNEEKTDGVYITSSYHWQLNETNGFIFNLDDGNWLTVQESIFDLNNWQYVTEDEVFGN